MDSKLIRQRSAAQTVLLRRYVGIFTVILTSCLPTTAQIAEDSIHAEPPEIYTRLYDQFYLLDRTPAYSEILTSKLRKTIVEFLKSPVSKTTWLPEHLMRWAFEPHLLPAVNYQNVKFFRYQYRPYDSWGVVHLYHFVQWQNQEGQLFAYDLNNKLPKLQYGPAYHLGSQGSSELYLLYGSCAVSVPDCVGAPVSSQGFYVLQIKGDYLILDYPAFGERSSIESSEYDMFYDEKTKNIEMSEQGPTEYHKLQGQKYRSAYIVEKQYTFNGKKFIKTYDSDR
jgi:hypothetical protein